MDWLDKVKWSENGLVPAVAQEAGSGRVLNLAWMNREALQKTVASGEAHYWSRSRASSGTKARSRARAEGEIGAARLRRGRDTPRSRTARRDRLSHRARELLFQRLEDGEWRSVEAVLKDPREIYSS